MNRTELTNKFNKIMKSRTAKKSPNSVVLADDVHRVAMKTPNLYRSHSVPIVRKMQMHHE